MKTIILCILLIPTKIALSYEFSLSSNESQTQVIELFTSEGCSSCPPADRWLSSLRAEKGLWRDFIPLAFHVDYWDYIGWKDDFALSQNSQRQRLYYNEGNIPSVYTPGIIKTGREWRSWRYNAVVMPQKNAVGSLSVALKGNQLKASFNNLTSSKALKLNVTLLAMNVESHVNAGENQGKRLKHDFVVIKSQQFLSENPQWDVFLKNDFFQSPYQRLAFVVWVEDLNNPTPIQAVGQTIN